MSTNLVIAGKSFTIEPRYVAGHALTENEAAALNQTRAENIRNNLAKKVKEQPSFGQEDVTAFASAYEFGQRVARASKAPVDPLEAEALRIATVKVREAIARKGTTGVTAAQVKDLAERVLEDETKGAAIRKIAKANLAAFDKAAEGLDLDGAVAEVKGEAKPRAKKAQATGDAPETAAAA